MWFYDVNLCFQFAQHSALPEPWRTGFLLDRRRKLIGFVGVKFSGLQPDLAPTGFHRAISQDACELAHTATRTSHCVKIRRRLPNASHSMVHSGGRELWLARWRFASQDYSWLVGSEIPHD